MKSTHQFCLSIVALALSMIFTTAAANAAVLSVGAGKSYTLPSQAAAAAHDGDTIEIDAGSYPDDSAVWKANGLTIKGVGGRPLMNSKGMSAEEKAIWVIKGDDTTVENIEFTGCAVKDRNGAGIRQEGRNLTVRKCFIHDNENGIFAGDNLPSEINIEFCEFAHNGYGNGQSHNIYLNYIKTFKMKGCYVHNANAGNNVKSRAQNNFIAYNRLTDDEGANTALSLDFPNGGACYVVGNIVRKSKHSGSTAIISIGAEGAKNSKQALFLINNTFSSGKKNAALFKAQGGTNLRILDNVLFNVSKNFEASNALEMTQINHNLSATPKDFVDAANLDFNLAAKSEGRHTGISAGFADGIDLTPKFEYVDQCAVKPRSNGYDLGAFQAN